MSNLIQSAKENLQFLGISLVIIVAIFAAAAVIEKWIRKKNQMPRSVSPARRVAIVGVFSAISAVLMQIGRAHV